MTSAERSLHPSYLLDRHDDGSVQSFITCDFMPALKANPTVARAEFIRTLTSADVKGCGGPGARVGKKFATVLKAPGAPKYLVVNGDESEPGTFKDKALMEQSPDLVIQGIVMAALTVGAKHAIIYIRHEYQEAIKSISRGIDRAALELGINGSSVLGSDYSLNLSIFESAGGYICGDQTAMLEAIEGRRAEPRNRPPEPEMCGLFGMPTLVHNVESISWVALIATHGDTWYRNLGANGAVGRRLFSVSGNVRAPGVYEVPNGTPLRGLIIDHAMGVTEGRTLKAIATSGPSGGFLPARLPVQNLPAGHRKQLPASFLERHLPPDATHLDVLDLELNLEVFRGLGLALGGGIVVYDERANMLDQALNASEFFRNESCGKCVPCRLGTQRLVEIASRIRRGEADKAALERAAAHADELLAVLEATSICGLGMVAAKPLTSALHYFPGDVIPYLRRAFR
jgi:formate dehydrogenase beta subunit